MSPAGQAGASEIVYVVFIGGPPDQRSIIYQYHPQREAEVALQFFMGYQGGLHCDGYGGYSPLLKLPSVVGLRQS